MSKKLLLIGGGGHCKTVIEAAETMNLYDEIEIVDIPAKIGENILGYRVSKSDDDLLALKSSGFGDAFISLGSMGNPIKRVQIYQNLKNIGFNIPIIKHTSAEISSYATIKEGTLIGKNVIINADTKLGVCAILNTGCIIEHDCSVGNFSHIAPSSVLSGNVTIGEDTHIGANTVIRQGIKIGSRSIIGIGSVVVQNIEDSCLAYGNPCRKVGCL
ncbi:acetyltransferase [Eubacteriaceae bacterium ES2]|nr:acetyltransferase [Eubacteriaceae bacterium ES2]